jgi:DNA-binding beta-propeller fold protein YncE
VTSRPGPSPRVRRRRTFTVLAALTALGLGVAWSDHSGAQPERTAESATQVSPPSPLPPVSAGTAAAAPQQVYAHAGLGDFAPATRGVPYLLYVPESASNVVDVVDPVRMKVVGRYVTGLDPQHVVPSYDLKTLWSTNDLANTLTPFDPKTGRPRGPAVAVEDPYNLYFVPGGKQALVVQEQLQRFGFYDAQTMAPTSVVDVHCKGVDHLDFSADETFLVASCEFAHKLLRFDLATHRVTGYLSLPGSAPQDVRLTPDGKLFVVADKKLGGVHLIDAATFTKVGFLHTGRDAHGIYPSRDGKLMYISNRGAGSISVLDPYQRRIVATWKLPHGGSPDMGGLSPDGSVLWMAGRYDARIYAISTRDGHLVASLHIPAKPHGLCVWPQPGRYSLGHTASMR